MKCVIIDDEPHAIEVLRRYVQQTESLSLMEVFRDPVRAAGFLIDNPVDLVFLDINMPGMTGMQLLKSLPRRPLVVFTTAYSDFGAESYEYDAVDYLMKPITHERFLKAVAKARGVAVRSGSHTSDVVFLKSGTQVFGVKLSEVTHISKDGNYLVVHVPGRKILVRENMSDVFTIFPEELFCQVHKSFVVSLQHLTVIDNHQVEVNKTVLPIGASYREELMRRVKGRS